MYSINFIAVLVSAIINMALGFLWYSPALFGKKWMTSIGKTPEELEAMKQKMGKTYFITFITSIVTTYILAFVINLTNTSGAGRGALIGFIVWLGFIATTAINDVLYEKKPWALYYINTGYSLVSLIIVGIVLGVWQ